MKVFISHSSVDKDFARELIENIGRDLVYFDQYSFEPGEELSDSIKKSINNSDIFVLLISNEALNSSWVKEEISLALELMIRNDLVFLPYCIDETIKPKDTRLDSWIWEKLIINYSYPKLLARAIQRKIAECLSRQFPNISNATDLFVGRNNDLANLERAHYKEDLKNLRVMFVSGFPFVGRKSVLQKFIFQYVKTDYNYKPIVIHLESTNSLEQLVILLNEYVGLVESEDVLSFIAKGMDETKKLCYDLLQTLDQYHEKIIIDDDITYKIFINRKADIRKQINKLTCILIFITVLLIIVGIYIKRYKKHSK